MTQNIVRPPEGGLFFVVGGPGACACIRRLIVPGMRFLSKLAHSRYRANVCPDGQAAYGGLVAVGGGLGACGDYYERIT